ncbi:hypothetical protein DID88_001346 [Monilinia fructigena]|uniref:Uncharacterized protein n=1 Tax=Monilinia fructigena TaxID=38457 RepID=A0A395IYA7_9HELO|nr:hypothetical protein DID88_001346 [Monilinia fructigena]
MADYQRQGSHISNESADDISEFGTEYDFEPYQLEQDDKSDDDDKSLENKGENFLPEDTKPEDNKLKNKNFVDHNMDANIQTPGVGADENQSGSGKNDLTQTQSTHLGVPAFLNGPFQRPLDAPKFGDLDLYSHSGRMKAKLVLKHQSPEVIAAIEKKWHQVNKDFHRTIYEIMKAKDQIVQIEAKETRFLDRQAELENLVEIIDTHAKYGKAYSQEFLDHVEKRLNVQRKFETKEGDPLGTVGDLVNTAEVFKKNGPDYPRDILDYFIRRLHAVVNILDKKSSNNHTYLTVTVGINTANAIWYRDLQMLHFAINKMKKANNLPLDLNSEYKFEQWRVLFAEEFKKEEAEAKDN